MTFRVNITRDVLDDEGKFVFKEMGLELLDAEPHIRYEFMREFRPVGTPEQLRDCDGALWLIPRVTRETLEGNDQLAGIARIGVGYDMVDLDACTEADVAVFISRGAVNRSVAEAIITWMLMLGHKAMLKDRLTREGRWSEKGRHNGSELRDRVIGTVGFGGIGGELKRLLEGFGIARFLVFDPYMAPEQITSQGATPVDLDTLMAEADYLAINCPLTPETRGLIGAAQLARMKPTAYLVNTARGGIVNEAALAEALRAERIAGAALDVFDQEPPPPDNPLLRLENVILAPHAIAWTDEIFRDNGRMACTGLVRLSRGELPDHIVNPAVVERPGFQRKLARLKERYQQG
jgi:phosphoglycerate dehydrogenase-like enzyme